MKIPAATVPAENPRRRHRPVSTPPSNADETPPLPFVRSLPERHLTGDELYTLELIRQRTGTLRDILAHLEDGRIFVSSPGRLDLVAAQLSSVIQTWFVICSQKPEKPPAPPLI